MKKKCFVTLVFSLLCWQLVFSCSCMPHGPLTVKDFNEQNTIFIGKAQSIRTVQSADRYEEYEITFVVSTAFKGVGAKKEVKVYTNTSSAACGLNVVKGQIWLLYANLFNGQLSTNMCSRSALLPYVKTREMDLLRLFAAGNGAVWKDGNQLQGEGKFINKLPTGEWKYYYSNGFLAEEGRYVDGRRDGQWIKYVDVDKLEAQMWGDGRLRKNAKLFRKALKLKIASVTHYDNGELSGTFIEYNEHYQPQRLINYFKDKEHGLAVTYYPSGLIEEQQRFSNGELDGMSRRYYEHGGLMYEGKYEKGNAGTFKVYDEKGASLGDSAGPPYYDSETKKLELIKANP